MLSHMLLSLSARHAQFLPGLSRHHHAGMPSAGDQDFGSKYLLSIYYVSIPSIFQKLV